MHIFKRFFVLASLTFLVSADSQNINALFNLPDPPNVRIMGIKRVEFLPYDGIERKITRHRILGEVFNQDKPFSAKTDMKVRIYDIFQGHHQSKSDLSLTVRSLQLVHRIDGETGYHVWEGPVDVQGTQFIVGRNGRKTSRPIHTTGKLYISDSVRHTKMFNSLSMSIPADPRTERQEIAYNIILDAWFPQ